VQSNGIPTQRRKRMQGRIASSWKTRQQHESHSSQLKALQTLIREGAVLEHFDPLKRLSAEDLLATKAVDRVGTAEEKDKLLIEAMKWFKRDFFQWAGKLECPGCASKKSEVKGMGTPNEYELNVQWASRVEIHACKDCGAEFRFPRINNPAVLLETKLGRCGEWANCFCLISCALGFETRYVSDWTDHVWAECWSERLDRFIHCDVCEGPRTIDSPLMYCNGWKKKLTYIIAFGKDHVVDVTKRYSGDYEDVMTRRNLISEEELLAEIGKFNKHIRKSMRDKLLFEQLAFLGLGQKKSAELKETEKQGRISGEEEWKRLRGEI